jgi:hypothetical protein
MTGAGMVIEGVLSLALIFRKLLNAVDHASSQV